MHLAWQGASLTQVFHDTSLGLKKNMDLIQTETNPPYRDVALESSARLHLAEKK